MSVDGFIIIVNILIFSYFLLSACRFSIFSPYFLLVFHLFMAVPIRAAFLYYVSPENSLFYEIYFEIGTFLRLCLFCYVAFIFLELWMRKPSVSTNYRFALLRVNTDFDDRRFRKLIFLSYTLLMVNFLVNIQVYGGFFQFLVAMQGRVSTVNSSLAYFSITFDLLVILSVYLFYLAARYRCYILAVFLLTAFVVVMLVVNGGRGNLIQYFISLGMVFWLARGMPRIRILHLVLLGGLFVVVAVGGLASRVSAQQDTPISVALSEVGGNFAAAVSGPFAIYDHFRLSEIYEEEVGNDYGIFYLENLLRPIPRSLWSEKPQVLGKKVREYFWGDSQGGIPPSYFGEFYISFGYVGIAIGALFLALISLFFQNIFIKAMSSPPHVIAAAILVPYFSFNLMRGGVDVGFTRLVIYLFFLLLVSYFSSSWAFKIKRLKL